MFEKKTMSKYTALFLFLFQNLAFAQGVPQAQLNRGYDVGSNGVLSDSRLLDLFENIKNRVTSRTININSIKGSPYFNEAFQLGEVEYFGERLKGNIYLRLNAFSDEFEVASNAFATSTEEVLIKNNKVSCFINGETFRYLGFINENGDPGVGYVKELFKGKVYSFYEKSSKLYMEATQARTSLERSFPARFVDKISYFYAIKDGSLLPLKLTNKKVLEVFNGKSEKIKEYLETSEKKFKTKEEVISLLEYLEKF